MTDLADAHVLVRLAFERGGSVRLRNCILSAQNDGVLRDITIDEIERGDPAAINKLLKVQNLGSKTLAELKSLISLGALLAPLPLHSKTNDATLVQSVKPTQRSPIAELSLEPDIESPLDSLNFLVEKERQILSDRLGLNDAAPLTLAEIGESKLVSRERVRQVESKAYERLNRMFQKTFARFRMLRQGAALTSLSVHNVITAQDETDLFFSLPVEMRLLVRAEYRTARAWLDSVCHKVPGGWLLPAESKKSFDSTRLWLEAEVKKVRLPCPITYFQHLAASQSSLLLSALHLSDQFNVYDGYILAKGSSRRTRRAVRVHRLLCEYGRGISMLLSDIKAKYRRLYSDDQCSGRDLHLTFLNNSHLFLNLYDFGWLPLGRPPESAHDFAGDTQSSVVLDEDMGIQSVAFFDTDTLKGILAQILLQHGPQSFNDLRRIFVARVGNRYSKASVGPILISTDEFPRIGPGIYAHRSYADDLTILDKASGRLLLNKSQCETFCRAVWAGESDTLYPLWTKLMQWRWAEWCLQSHHVELLSSLLSVCDVESWPIKAGDRSRWLRLQDQHRIYLLEESSNELEGRVPTFTEFLAAAALACTAGSVSWMSINRATGYRVEDRHSVSTLALLVALGIVEPSTHWQQKHHVTNRAREIIFPLLESISRDDHASWGRSLVRAIRSHYDNLFEPGWTSWENMQSLFDALAQKAIAADLLEDVVLRDMDPYETLKKQLTDEVIFESLRKQLSANRM